MASVNAGRVPWPAKASPGLGVGPSRFTGGSLGFQVNAPMVFEANHGQTHSSVAMLARGRGYTAFFKSAANRRGDGDG